MQIARAALIAAALGALGGATGCTHKKSTGLPAEDGVTRYGPCDSVLFAPDAGPGTHVAQCSYVEYATNPPSYGPHYPVWADYREYSQTFAPGFFVHSLEHGGVALLWGCDKNDAACLNMIHEAEAWLAGREQDPLCTPPLRSRVLMLPYPKLGRAFAAVLWGHYLTADCFDASLVDQLVGTYYGQNYENLCTPGLDPASAPKGCGEKPP